jgi:hypothetical protein
LIGARLAKIFWAALFVAQLFSSGSLLAQDNPDQTANGAVETAPWQTTVFLRTSAARNGQFFNFSEATVDNGRWIALDIGWLNFGKLGYGEVFGGGGRIQPVGEKAQIIAELYFDRSYGPLSDHANYILTYVAPSYSLGKGWSADAAVFPYLPIDHKGSFQLVVDYAALRKQLNTHLQVSAGYAAYKFGSTALVNKEFGSFTLLSQHHGSLETMLLHVPGLPGGFGVEFRYVVALKHGSGK